MNPAEIQKISFFFLRLFSGRFSGRASDWVAEHVFLNEPKIQGPFNFVGREYLRAPVDDWGISDVTDQTLVFGTRTGKTRTIMGGMAFRLFHEAMRALWVLPNSHGTGGARNVSKTKWRKMLEASPCLAQLIPRGTNRFDYSTMQQIINGSIVDFAGSNSPANLAGNPCDVVVQDEVDKFKATGEKEADASYLADQRAKEFSNPKRVKTSTPTTTKGLIWQSLLKTDIRRRFLPCPRCSKFVVLAWSKEYTALPPVGAEAFMRWDDEARKAKGWDYDRVEKSARFVCPHCEFHILDQHKTAMDAAGEWRPTRSAAAGFRGYHLPSMYAISSETTVGRMAVRFLQSKHSAQGLRGFINSDLAEPYEYQDRLKSQTIVINSGLKKTREGMKDRSCRVASADRQKGYKHKGELPHWWLFIADVKKHDDGRVDIQVVFEGKEMTEANLVARLKEYEVEPSCVIIDSGWDTDHVYSLCIENGYYCLKAEGDHWFSGHEDGGRKIYSPPKPLHTMIQNRGPKHDYILHNGEWLPDPREPMFIFVGKFPLMDFFNWVRTSKHITIDIPADVSTDFHEHMKAWGVEERKHPRTNETIKQWMQYKDRDDLLQCFCYVCLLLLDMGILDPEALVKMEETTPTK